MSTLTEKLQNLQLHQVSPHCLVTHKTAHFEVGHQSIFLFSSKNESVAS